MNTCSTCRHWEHRDNDAGLCNLITPGGTSEARLARIAVWSDDADPAFLTRGTFSCAEHEPPDDAA